MKKGHRITGITPGSIAEEMDMERGDILLEINHKPIIDVFDYHFHMNDEFITVLIKKRNGEEWELEIEKEPNEDLGLGFDHELMDEYRSCKNRCIFCFIDQMPPGMRDTLYFKDDDARLSFLRGNYITLTNISEEEMERILLYKLMPINISIHTTNMELRNRMLNNRFAGESLNKIKRLFAAGIEMNSQIVLCKGYNDGNELWKTMQDLSEYLPLMKSLSVVPVGLTRFREGLVNLPPFQKEDALSVLEMIHEFQRLCMEKFKTRFVYASDEWYLMADMQVPDAKHYEGFPQLENGVGMVRNFLDEFHLELKGLCDNKKIIVPHCEQDVRKKDSHISQIQQVDPYSLKKNVTLVTGVLFAPYLKECINHFHKKYPNVKVEVKSIVNRFFGETVTVAGLLTGKDVMEQLRGMELGDVIYIPSNMLREGEDVFLDDISIKDLESTLQREVRVVKSDGIAILKELVRADGGTYE